MTLPLLARSLDSPDRARARLAFHLLEAEEAAWRVIELEGPGPTNVRAWLRVRRERRKHEPDPPLGGGRPQQGGLRSSGARSARAPGRSGGPTVTQRTPAIVRLIRRLRGGGALLDAWHLTLGRDRDTGLWYVGLRSKVRKPARDLEARVPDGTDEQVARSIVALASGSEIPKGRA